MTRSAASVDGEVLTDFTSPVEPVESVLRVGLTFAGLACIAGLFLFPFLWPLHTLPLSSFYNEWLAAILLLAACLAYALPFSSGRMQGHMMQVPVSALLFIPLIAVVLYQWAAGMLTYASDALFPLWILFLAVAAIVLGHVARQRVGLERLLCWISVATIAGGLANFVMQILQLSAAHGVRFTYFNFNSNGAYFGNLAQVNHLATYYSWALVGALYLYAVNKLRGYALLPLIVVLLAGAALTSSRTSWLHVLWIAGAGAWMMRSTPVTLRPIRWQWLLALPIAYAGINLILPVILEWIGFGVSTTALGRVASAPLDVGRLLLLEQGWKIFLQSPWIGVGPGQFYFNQFLLLDHMNETLFATSTHNVFLDLLVFAGVLGAVPFSVLLFMWFRRAIKTPLSSERMAAWLILSVLGIHAMLELPHTYTYFLLPAALLVGALETGQLGFRQRGLLRALPLIASLYGVAVSVMLMGQYRELETLYVNYYTKQKFVSTSTVDSAGLERIENFRRSTWFGGAAEFLLCYNFALNENALQQKLAISGRAVRYLPEPNVVYRHVVLLALDGRQDEGARHLARLRKSFPKAYEEIAEELTKLAAAQPAVFGRLGASLIRAES